MTTPYKKIFLVNVLTLGLFAYAAEQEATKKLSKEETTPSVIQVSKELAATIRETRALLAHLPIPHKPLLIDKLYQECAEDAIQKSKDDGYTGLSPEFYFLLE